MAQTVVEALSAAHDVTVVCGRPSYEPTERRAWRLWQTEKPGQSFGAGNVRIIRVGSTDYSRSQMGRGGLNYLTYVARSLPRGTFVPCYVVRGQTDRLFEGMVRGYGSWETLVGAARKLSDEGIGLVFVGDGAQRGKTEAAAAGCANVRFLPFFPASKIASVLASADAHIVTIRRGLEGVIVPSKMYGILAAGKPILAVTPRETDVAAIGERREFAICADPENASEVATAMKQMSQ